MTTTTLPRAAIYCRISATDPNTNYSLDAQLQASRAYAERNGFTIVGEFADAKSGATLDRPGLTELRRLITAGAVDTVVCYASDRLTRSTAHNVVLRDEFKQRRVTLHTVQRGAVKGNLSGTLFSNIETDFSEYERGRITERTKTGRVEKIGRGLILSGGQPPFGYTYTTTRGEVGAKKRSAIVDVSINEEEAAIIRNIYRWYAIDKIGMPAIVDKLNEAGILPPSARRRLNVSHHARSGKWAQSTIWKILQNSAYRGELVTTVQGPEDEDGFPTSHTATIAIPYIVEPALWAEAEEVRRERFKHARRNGKRIYLLSGLIRCSCGAAMGGYPKRKRTYYRCMAGCTPSARCDLVDPIIWDWVADVVLDEDHIRERLAARRSGAADVLERLQAERASYEKELRAIDGEMEEIVRAVARKVFSFEAAARYTEQLEQRKHSAMRERDRVDRDLLNTDHSVESEAAIIAKVRAYRERLTTKGSVSPLGRRELCRDVKLTVRLWRDEAGRLLADVEARVTEDRDTLLISGGQNAPTEMYLSGYNRPLIIRETLLIAA